MNITRFLALFLSLMIVGHNVQAQVNSDISQKESPCTAQSAKILILGTYHMDNPRLDAKNLEADDVLLPRRQREITELIEKLARFKPTKIAIEAPYRNTTWTDRYKKYLAGEHKLGRNEIEQIGFQLAKRLNLPTLYPIDFSMFMSGLVPNEIEYPQPKPIRADDAKPVEAPPLSEGDKLLRRSTVTEFLQHMNREETIRKDHAQYMEMLLPTEDAAIYGRTDLLTNWYKRNLRIFTNINRITEFPNDRVLVIVGSGHLKILKDLAADSPYFCLVEAETYLK
ncbi:MAG: DUF5694 domain-containing protein [Pyrinomonadaceae bacterium]